MLHLNNIRKQFGEKVAVDVADFTVHQSDILGLVGNNGAGKTTLFRLILDLLKADEGKVQLTHRLPAENPSANDAERMTVTIDPSESEEWKIFTGAYIDDGFLIDFLTPDEYFAFIGQVSGVSESDVDTRLQPYMAFMADEIVGQKKLIRDLSAGNKQKVGIVAALLNEPELLILDEPFNFLDPTSQHQLKRILSDYHLRTQATILVSSHNLDHTVDISTRIALMENGQIIQDLDNKDKQATETLTHYFNVDR